MKTNERFGSAALNAIIEAEIAAGNSIIEVSTWPPLCSRVIILKFQFSQDYENRSLQHRILNDPHYWYAEYHHVTKGELLACGFKKHPN